MEISDVHETTRRAGKKAAGVSGDVAAHPFRVLSLFSGIGGLDLGVKLAVPRARTVGYVERDAFAAAVLVARMEDAALDEAPIWDDVSTFDGQAWRGRVDCIVGGFPCQDISLAGRGAGIAEGTRSGLWLEYARIIRDVAPRYVFVENVSALLARGMDIVLRDLAELGFDAEWDVFRACDVGAPHIRRRVFIMAHADGDGLEGERRGGLLDSERPALGRHAHRCRAFPPGPDDAVGWRDWLAVHPGTEPTVRRDADGTTARLDQLRALGNGVVPLVAAQAWRVLSERLAW